ncbi:hypothetical protein V5O48_013997 [Marasmius crinis-equi]|uniref:Uncharacterized protein n=1 Tax=Marasmius crinis-equi TaxID=585013 RepID=A0ABR3EYJ0_9AGAR
MPLDYILLPENPPVLKNVNNKSLGQEMIGLMNIHPRLAMRDGVTTRRRLEDWLSNARKKLLSEPSWIDAIYEWFSACLDMKLADIQSCLSPPNAIDHFISTMALDFGNEKATALAELQATQLLVATGLASYQHNPMRTQEQVVADAMKPSDNADSLREPLDNTTNSSASIDNNLLALVPPSSDEVSPNIQESQFVKRCGRWHAALQQILNLPSTSLDNHEPMDPPTFCSLQSDVVHCLQDMNKITKTVYSQESFLLAVRHSGLAQDILRISHPAFYAQHHHPHNSRLIRLHSLGIQFARILDRWSEPVYEQIRISSENVEDFASHSLQGGTRKLNTGKDFVDALRANPGLIPTAANPSSVFFLCSEQNFKDAWDRWLKWHLRVLDYQVVGLDPIAVYRKVMLYLKTVNQNIQDGKAPWETEMKVDEILKVIVQRTLEFRDMRNRLKKSIRKGDLPFRCRNCSHLPAEDQCWTRRTFVRRNDKAYIEKMRGCGFTFVPKGERMKPVPPPKGKGQQPTKLVSEELEKISPRKDILERCGKHVFIIEDSTKPGTTVDFVLYNAFPPEYLDLLIRYHDMASGVRPLVRGQQFRFWSSGVMFPFGARLPSGGIAGDTYAAYAGITAETIAGIEVLFRHAESSMMLSEVAILFHPELVDALDKAGEACDRVGLSGVSLFTCTNYSAPLHTDDDAARGLCCQLVKDIESNEYEEYGFCNLQYGYYISTRSNMVWSFDSSDLHGTVLPSQKTIDTAKSVLRLRGGASRGKHKTVPKKDKERAEDDQRTRHNYNLRCRVWRPR